MAIDRWLWPTTQWSPLREYIAPGSWAVEDTIIYLHRVLWRLQCVQHCPSASTWWQTAGWLPDWCPVFVLFFNSCCHFLMQFSKMHKHTAASCWILRFIACRGFTSFLCAPLENIRHPTQELFPSRSVKQSCTTGCFNWGAAITFPNCPNAGLFSKWGLCSFEFQSFL